MILIVRSRPVGFGFGLLTLGMNKHHPAILQGVVSSDFEFSKRHADEPEPVVQRR
jgi:hypothetical protein